MQSHLGRLARALFFCALLAGVCTAAAAQTAPALHGTVTDVSGAILPGVTVTATPAGGGATAAVTTDTRGEYVFRTLGPASYVIEVSLAGFRAKTLTVTIAAGEAQTLDVEMEIASLAETVTVTRTLEALDQVPNAVAVVEADVIQFAQRQVSPVEALAGIPGLFAENRYNYSSTGGVRLAIRAPLASGLRSLQIVQDGIPLTTADGTTQPNNIELGSEGRVEIIRGPSSVLYGNSAGGVINMRTEFPSTDHLLVQPDVQFGSYGYQREQVKAEGTAGRVAYLFNVNRMETDGYRAHSRADVRKANMVVRAALSPRTELRGVFNYYDMPFGENPSTLTLADARNNPTSVRPQAITEGWGENSSQGQGGITVEHHFSGGQMFRATGWGMWRSVWNPIPSRLIDLARHGGGLRSELAGRNRVGAFSIDWTTGVDASSQRDDRNEFRNAGVPAAGGMTREGPLSLSQLENVLSVAPFAQASVALSPRWRVTAGARYDYYTFEAIDRFLSDGDQSGQRVMHAASPKVGVVYSPDDAVNLYANVATAYQTPVTVELSNRPPGQGGGFNQDLQPATLRTVEGGARGFLAAPKLRYELVGYVSTLENAFVPFQRPDEQTYYLNAGESSRNGIEALLEWTPIARLKARLAYTYQDFTFTRFRTGGVDYAGKHEPGTPPHQLFAGGTYEAPFGIRATAQYRWVDAYPVDNANTFSNWAYRVVDVRAGFDRKVKGVAVRPFAGIDNLFNERYNSSTAPNSVGNRFYEPAPDRAFYFGVTVGATVF